MSNYDIGCLLLTASFTLWVIYLHITGKDNQ